MLYLVTHPVGSIRGHSTSHHLTEGNIQGWESDASGHHHLGGKSSPKVHVRTSHVTTVAIQEDRTDVVR